MIYLNALSFHDVGKLKTLDGKEAFIYLDNVKLDNQRRSFISKK